MPLHRLNLKVGAIVILLRNLSIGERLCNGTRMEVQRLHEHCVEASLVTGSNRGRTVRIPRIKLSLSDANIAFTLNRLQFPIRLAYSMTINKAQGQTFEKVGIHLPQPVFSHGQLYVTFSRSRAMNNIKVRVMTLN
uniref:DNA helicase Pif1-like 2B domain-containing protein n=1 Tax=Octopus bimaculoides TaxID=37653 RepID=A0A0L8IGX7_OCTBM